MTARAAPATARRAGSSNCGGGRQAHGRWLPRLVALAAMLGLLMGVSASPARALECGSAAGIPLDDGCLFTITGSDTPEPADGFAVTNADGVPLWDFVRGKDPQAIGYPISQRWADGPFTLQAFQKVILQWDPQRERMNYYNTLDALATRYPNVALPNVPGHDVLAEDTGAEFAQVIRNHLAILEQNDRIKARFLAESDWLNLYGLPIRYEERAVNGNPLGLQVLRTQRTVFEVWNVPAPGTTPGRVQLQNVPDKVKRLSNVIIPDAAKTPAALPEPALPPEIRSLPWAADGVTDSEQRLVTNLQRIAGASQAIYGRLLSGPAASWLEGQPSERTLGATELLVTIAEHPWSAAVRQQLLDHTLLRLVLDEGEEDWPRSFRRILEKPWTRDGVSWDELKLIDEFAYMLRRLPTNPWSDSYFGKSQEMDVLLGQMLDMPFLQTIEGYEVSIIGRLSGTGQGMDYLQKAVTGWIHRGGITDYQVLAYLYPLFPRNTIDPNDFREHPERLGELLDLNRLGITIERRTVSLPHSGNMLLIVLRMGATSPSTMDVLEQETRRIEALMGEPLKKRYTILLLWEQPPDTVLLPSAYNAGYFMHFDAEYFSRASASTVTKSNLAYLLSDYYWTGADPWISRGAAMFLVMRRGHASREQLYDVHSRCETERIVDLLDDMRDFGVCYQSLGASLFLELYDALGDRAFRDGFARLARAVDADGLYCLCGLERKESVDHVRESFTTGATEEVRGVVEGIITRRYYGE